MMKLSAALALFCATVVQGSQKDTLNEVILYSLQQAHGGEVPLLDVLEDLPRYFEDARDLASPADFPPSFSFPKSFSYEMTFGKVTRANKRDTNIFVGTQSAIFDDENNRVRVERVNKVFQEHDTEVRLYDFNKMRMLVSDPVKKMCLKQKIKDVSPVSMVPRENDQIVISDAIQSLWVPPQSRASRTADAEHDWHWNDSAQKPLEAKTKYLGQHNIILRSTGREQLDSEVFHVFVNNYSFHDLETKYGQHGGTDGATTLYLFRELTQQVEEDENAADETLWQLAGVATKYRNQKPDVYCNLGNSFKALDRAITHNNEFQLKFYQKECHEYLDEYMLIDGNQLVKRLGRGDNMLQ